MDKEELERRFEDQVAGTAKRSYGSGRIGPDDDGELAAAMFVDKRHRKIVIDFGKAVTWLALNADDADNMANLLREQAAKLREMFPPTKENA
jgi:accessory colonization factor AcfC